MPALQSLRKAHHIARCVLLWFAMSLGVAIAAPLVHAERLQLVCSAAGSVKAIAVGDAAQGLPGNGHTLDCPLCIGLGAPPPLAAVCFSAAAPRGLAAPLRQPEPLSVNAAAPLPARGPPPQA